ncbi:PH domain-containing protein [Salininema proteolyticum]|uniref:PH domain-containing protein n=1 Tax=Salininema proteolyticum TaxID=1607685 RepID=A0ABV8U0M8_9ACTN
MSVKAPASSARLKIRRPGTLTATAMMAWLCAWPLGIGLFLVDSAWKWGTIPLGVVVLGVPLVIAYWAWNSGVDVDAEGITVKGLFGGRRLPWRSIDGFATDRDGVQAILSDQSQVSLKPMRAASLPQVIEVGGQEMADSPASGGSES